MSVSAAPSAFHSATCIVLYTPRVTRGSTIVQRTRDVPSHVHTCTCRPLTLMAHSLCRNWTELKWTSSGYAEYYELPVRFHSVPEMSRQCYKRNLDDRKLTRTSSRIYDINFPRFIPRLKPRLHDTTTTGCILYTAGCQTGCTTGLTTGCIV